MSLFLRRKCGDLIGRDVIHAELKNGELFDSPTDLLHCPNEEDEFVYFSGGADENIEVWITQFDESLHFLNDAEKLQEMLPKFRQTAADFVFGQLTYAERSDYQSLLLQLELRFKTIETPRMFQIQFDNRKQRVGESYHNFACELKRLYDKAYPRRPWRVRNEDLVRKFLNGCLNRKVAAQVEYHQSPKTIDHAVYEMVHYLEIFGPPDSNIQPTITQSN